MAVRDFVEKTCQKNTLKTPKKLVAFASNCSTYSKIHNESRAIIPFKGFPRLNFFEKKNMFKKMVYE